MRPFGALFLAFGVALVLSACAGKTTGATSITDTSATLTATARCDQGEVCRWYWEFWQADSPRSPSAKTPVQGPVSGPTGDVSLSTKITGLQPSTTYRWVFCGSPNDGAGYVCMGPHGQVSSTSDDPPADYATFTTSPEKTLAAVWNGTTWAIQPTPNPSAGVGGSFLNAVSCTSATACIAVGHYVDSTGNAKPLAERWNGTSWAIQTVPLPSGAQYAFLFGVACIVQVLPFQASASVWTPLRK